MFTYTHSRPVQRSLMNTSETQLAPPFEAERSVKTHPDLNVSLTAAELSWGALKQS